MLDRQKRKGPLVAYGFVLVFLLLAAAVGGGAYLYYSHFETHYRVEVGSQLSAIGQLKTNDLADWRRERLADASLLYGNVAFAALAKRYLGDPSDAQAEQELQSWLKSFETDNRYDQVRLLDTRGATRVPTPAGIPPVSSAISEHLTGVLRSGQVTFLDFYRDDDDGRAYLAVLVPISYGGRSYQALGAVLLRIDPATYLYPYIARWPTPSKTAETLLIRRDGSDVLFLNELRFRKDAALTLRIPLSSQDVPAVKAISGREGIVEGLDYRGVRVIADVRSVPNSPWFLVARMDAAEVDAPLRERLWQTALFVGIALLGTGAGLGYLWRHREAGLYRERAKAAEALRESEERLSLALEATSDGIYDADFVAGTTYHSPGYAAMLGYGSDELPTSQETWEGLLHPDDKESALQTYERSLKGEADDYCMEFRLRTKTGDWRWIESCGRVVRRDPAGNPLRLVGTHRDITNRKRAEEAFRESELKYRQVVENASEAVYVAQDGKLVFLNPATSTAFGRSAEDLTARPFIEFIHPDDRGTVLAYHQARSRGEEAPSVHAFRIVREAGDFRWAEVKVVRVDWLGKPASLCLMSDITERKLAETALQESEERFRVAQDVSLDGFTILRPVRDAQERIVDFTWVYENAAIARLNGTDPEAVVGQRLLELFPGHRGSPFLRAYQQVAESGEPYAFEAEYSGESMPTPTWFRIVVVPMGGEIAILAQDITAPKLAENALRESEDRYRSLVGNVPGIIFTMDLAGKITFVSPRIKETLGYERGEVINKSVLDLIPEEERQRAMEAIEKGMTGVGIKHFQTPMMKRSGERAWLECSFARVRKDGAVIGAQGTAVNITERKRAEEKIRSQLDELQRWHEVMLDREDRVREIKREVNELCRRVGEGIRYTSEEAQ
jgi:PAS domain S-box-containing protein